MIIVLHQRCGGEILAVNTAQNNIIGVEVIEDECDIERAKQ